MDGFTPELIKRLKQAGCYRLRNGKGDHVIGFSPITGRPWVVDNSTTSRHTAHGVLKQAGLPKAF